MNRHSLLNFYRKIVNSEKSFDIDYKNLSKQLIEKIDKAIEYLKTFHFIDNIRVLDIKEYEKLLEILGDKEIEEIPLFDGTLEQLNNLSILGDKENE